MFKFIGFLSVVLIIGLLGLWLGLYIKKYGFDWELVNQLSAEAKKILSKG